MATFPNKPLQYIVDTTHPKCPDHLYMIDETTGNFVDKGKAGANLTLTLNNSTWTTADLGGGGPASSPVISFDGVTDYARSAASFSLTGSCMMVVILKNDQTPPISGSAVFSAIAKSDTNLDFMELGNSANTQYLRAIYDDSSSPGISKAGTTDIYDSVWHMNAGIYYQDGANLRVGVSVDGASWATYSTAATGLWNMNRVCLGDRAGSSMGNETTGDVAAFFIYKDAADPPGTWTAGASSFLSSLFADPWQFLIPSSQLILPHRSAGGFLDLGGNFRG